MNTSSLLDLLSHVALKGAVVLLVALLLGLLLRRMAAARRYALWITAITTLAVLPVAMWVLPAWHVLPKASAELDWPLFEPELVSENAAPVVPAENHSATLPMAKSEAPPPAQAPAPPAVSWIISWQDVVAALPLAWMLIAALLLLRLGLSAWRLHRLEASLQPGQCTLLEPAAHELGLKRRPRLLIGPADSVPMVWGVFRPRLLLPQGFESWSPEKQRGVLLHELAHLKRGDPLALWAAQWVKALHWFNPLAWLTLRQLRADQERACDDTVLRQGVRASDYAQSLLDLSRHSRLAPGLSLCALTITRCAPVESRVKDILDPTRRREGLTLRWVAGLAACALLITLPVAMLHAIEGSALRGRILDRNGVALAESTKEKVRVYPLKTLAAHALGYVSGPDKEHPQAFGKSALEMKYDALLKSGKDLPLTLDARIQVLALQAMKDGGVERGAAVVLDPRNGDILAMVSVPSFDPNTFVPTIRIDDWKRYTNDKDYPLFDRCLTGNFSPGAAFLPLTALVGISAGVGDKTFDCQPAKKSIEERFNCWKVRQGQTGHGMIGLTAAVETSCSHYWYHFGMAAGFAPFGKVGQKVGFGQSYQVLDHEKEGVLPTQEWWEQHRRGREAWTEASTAAMAVGTSYVQVTPLQLAVLAATVGNGGRVPQPRLLSDAKTEWRADLIADGLPAAQIDQVREGMRLVVNGEAGTGRPAHSDKIMIAGRTGTTQTFIRNEKGETVEKLNTWFIGFAPFDKPTLAFAILKQGGRTGGKDCGPIAKRIVEETLALPADGSGEVKPVEEPLTAAREAQAQFDARAGELRAIVERVKPEDATGFELSEITVRDGQLLIRGIASSMLQALNYRGKLTAADFEAPLEWTFPVPTTMKDGKRVAFQALAVLVSGKEKDITPLEALKTSVTTLKDPRSNLWDEIRQSAQLAELPKRSNMLPAVMRGEEGDSSVHFYLLREDTMEWLQKSLGGKVNVSWLEEVETKSQRYPAKSGYEVEVARMESPRILKVTVHPPGKTTAAVDDPTIDARAQETLQQLKLLAEKSGVAVEGSKRSRSRLTVLGTGASAELVLNYLAKVKELDSQSGIQWDIPPPLILSDTSVQFKISGVYRDTASAEPPLVKEPESAAPRKPAGQADIRQQSDTTIRMRPALATQWSALKSRCLLADLPAGARPFDLGEPKERQMKSILTFRFQAPREEVRRWLRDSHCEFMPNLDSAGKPVPLASYIAPPLEEAALPQWPAAPEAFQCSYNAANRCMITVHSSSGDPVSVVITQARLSPLIAPDESQQPRPAGKLEPEHHREGLAMTEADLPALNVALQTLRPTISPQEVRLPTFRPQPAQVRLRAPAPPSVPTLKMPFPLNRLQGDLSPESEKALQRSLGSGGRMQQTLWVRASRPL